MTNLYRNESSDAKQNAQRNLCGRTHYVDDDTLRWHKSRVLATRVVDGGLLFAIITSDAMDMANTKRGFRYVVFDVFGNVISRVDLESSFRTRDQASKAMWAYLDTIDAQALTYEAMDRAIAAHAQEMTELRERIAAVASRSAAA